MPALPHLLALVILLGRLGDVGSTLFVTPTLALEANVIVRRFKLVPIVLGFALCFVPYLDVRLGVMVAVPSLLVTASNLSRGWMARAIGEKEAKALLLCVARRASLPVTLGMLAIATAFFCSAALLLCYLSEDWDSLSFWFGAGMLVYAIAVGGHGSIFVTRLFREAAATQDIKNAA
jgi:hypothetical protein